MKHIVRNTFFVFVAIIAILILSYHLFRGDSCLLSVVNNSDHKIIAFIALDTSLMNMTDALARGDIVEPHSYGKPAINFSKFGGKGSFIKTLLNTKDSSAYIGFVDSTLLFESMNEYCNPRSFNYITEHLDGGSQAYIFYHSLEKLRAKNAVYLTKMSFKQMVDIGWVYEISNDAFTNLNDTLLRKSKENHADAMKR